MAKKKAVRKKAATAKVEDRPPRDQHYADIRDKNREHRAAYVDWQLAKESASELKKRADRIGKELGELISRGPNPQLDLPFGEYDWASRSLTCLALSDSILDTLAENDINNLGDLRKFWADGGYLDTLKGLGSEKAATVADAFADYAQEHPEIFADDDQE